MDASAQSFSTESKKLMVRKIIMGLFKWRIMPYYVPFFNELAVHLRSPFGQVRGGVGNVMNDCVQMLWYCGATSVTQALEWNILSKGGLHENVYKTGVVFNDVVPAYPHASVRESIEKIFLDLSTWREIPRDKNVGYSDYGSASKTGMSFGYFRSGELMCA